MNFRQLIGQYALGNLPTEDLPGVAYEGLIEGLDSPSLVMLAGMENGNPFEIEQYFKAALSELNSEMPDRETASLEYAILIAQEIIEGKRGLKGIGKIIYEVIHSSDFELEDGEGIYKRIFFDRIYGLYLSYDDLLYADHPWSTKKSNQQLLKEIRKKLFKELKKWNKKMTGGQYRPDFFSRILFSWRREFYWG